MANTPINALPSPDDTSPNSPPIHFAALANQLDKRLVPPFATEAARNAAITAPTAGMLSAVGSQLQEYMQGVGWVTLMPTLFSAAPDGTVAPSGAKFMQFFGTTTVTTTAPGGFNIGLPVTFAKIVYVSLFAGDDDGGFSSAVVLATTGNNINARADSASGQGLGGAQLIRVNYHVVGWL